MSLSSAPAHGQGTLRHGVVTGSVREAETGEPIHDANVVVLGTTWGAATSSQGTFQIRLPAGTYPILVSFIGFEPQTRTGVLVEADRTTVLEFRLKQAIVEELPPIVVSADYKKPDVGLSSNPFVATEDDFRTLPVDEVEEVIARSPGVVMQGGELKIRGSRTSQILYQIDGMDVSNPLSNSHVDLSLLSVARSELITGGMDAEYGNAVGAIVNFTTKSGGRRFEGTFRYTTDDYGRADKTFTNYDRLALGLGGPTPFEDLAWYFSGEATYQDGEFLTTKRYPEHEDLGGLVKAKERANADHRAQLRLDWKPSRALRMSGELTMSQSRSDPYVHNWTTEGFVGRVLVLPEVRPNRVHRGLYSIAGSVTMHAGPWLERARRATYADIRDDPGCRYCWMPTAADQRIRAVRVVDFQGRGAHSPLFAFVDLVLFEGFQGPISRWVPDLEGDPGDSNKAYFNSAEHTPTIRENSRQLKWTLTHTLSPRTFYEVKVSRLSFDARSTVNGKTPEEFATPGRFVCEPGRGPRRIGSVDFYTDPDVPFFVTANDQPFYRRRNTATYLLRADVTTQRWSSHKVKGGLLLEYSDLDVASLAFPGQQRQFGDAYGLGRNVFHSCSPEGSFYMQDRWQHEGMVVNGGLRFDFFSPGSGVGIDIRSKEIRHDVERWQAQWSPRLGLAFPITDRDAFYFHYGRFIQFPPKSHIFASQDAHVAFGTLGNPNLDPESSISYQAGIKHQFSNNVSGQVAFFHRDYFGLVSSIEVTDDSTGSQNLRYVNRAFASSRGIELQIARSFAGGFAFDVAYTFSHADGVASDADFGRQAQGLRFLPTGELPLDWDQRHTLSTTLTLARSGDWSATAIHTYGSGLPWTPFFRFEKKQDPLLENSRRLPPTNLVSFRAEKWFSIHGKDLRLLFEGRNLLDEREVFRLAPGVFPALAYATEADTAYATETGRFGGAYLRDTDGDGQDEFFAVHDPRVFGPRRLFRIGLGVGF
ncbi:MAG: TonB-dependent receptor domain-containing protein [Candidatus Krumholzibacteriia bacterium]